MTRTARIKTLLAEAFTPTLLEVVDQSHLHHGHAGWREGGETHFAITIKAERLASLRRVDGHRLINQTLEAEFDSGLHALEIKILP